MMIVRSFHNYLIDKSLYIILQPYSYFRLIQLKAVLNTQMILQKIFPSLRD